MDGLAPNWTVLYSFSFSSSLYQSYIFRGFLKPSPSSFDWISGWTPVDPLHVVHPRMAEGLIELEASLLQEEATLLHFLKWPTRKVSVAICLKQPYHLHKLQQERVQLVWKQLTKGQNEDSQLKFFECWALTGTQVQEGLWGSRGFRANFK